MKVPGRHQRPVYSPADFHSFPEYSEQIRTDLPKQCPAAVAVHMDQKCSAAILPVAAHTDQTYSVVVLPVVAAHTDQTCSVVILPAAVAVHTDQTCSVVVLPAVVAAHTD